MTIFNLHWRPDTLRYVRQTTLFISENSFSFKHSATKVQSCAPTSIVRRAFHNSLAMPLSTTYTTEEVWSAKLQNIKLVGAFSECCTIHPHPEHNQISLTCLPEVPVWQCCYWSVAAPPTSGRPAGPGCSSAGLNSKCVFIWTSTSKYWALAPHLALWQQNWEQYDCYYATWIIAPLKVKFIDSKIDVA